MFDNSENDIGVHANGRLAILKTDGFEEVRAVRGLKDPTDETGLKYLTGIYVTKVWVEGTPVFFYFEDICFARTIQNHIWSVYPCEIMHGEVGRHSIRFRLVEEFVLRPTANKMKLSRLGEIEFVKEKNLPPKTQGRISNDPNGCFRRPVTHAVSVAY